MDKSLSKKQVNASRRKSSLKGRSLATESDKQVPDISTQLSKINDRLRQLDVDRIICSKQIYANLKCREDLIQQICILISAIENTLMLYDRAENAHRKLEVAMSAITYLDIVDFEPDDIHERQEIVEDVQEMQGEVNRTKRQLELIRRMCAQVEPYLKLKKVENETIHAVLCEKLGKIERSRQENIAKRKLILKARNSTKEDK